MKQTPASLATFALFLAALTALAQYPDWRHSGTLYVLTTPEGADLPEDVQLEDFPLLVRLDQDWFDFGQAQPSGQDIRFASGGEPLAYEIEEWDATAGRASIWLRIPQITGNSSQAVQMFWGKPDAANESDGKAVFNAANGYVSVWHLDGNPVDAAGALSAADTGTSSAPGIIGKARHFPGGKGLNCGEDLTVLPQGSAPNSSEVWVRAIQPNGRVIAWGNEKRQGKVTMYFSSPPHVRMDCYFSDANARGSSRLPMGEWVHLAHTYSKGEARVYVNGRLDGENKGQGAPLNIESPGRLYIGGWYNRYGFVGDLDEVRLSKVKRSAEWIRLQYENQKALNTAVGPLVRDGDSFAVSHQDISIAEGAATTVTATAGGARKLYWTIKEGERETLVAVDRFSYHFEAGRVRGDQSRVLQLKAVFADTVKTIDISVKIREAIPEPVFALKAPGTWDGRQTIEVLPQISNLAQMQAAGADRLSVEWQVSGLATIHRAEPDKLILEGAQNSGAATITATISNGGESVSASTTIEVREPNYDPWVVRSPQADEKPQDKQFYARDDRNQGTAHCNGKLSEPADTLLLKLYADGQLIDTLTQQPGPDLRYAFAVKLKPGLIRYKIELIAKTGDSETRIHQASDLLCGDAYIIEGQSNALATDTRDQSPDEPHEWVRSYALQDPRVPDDNLWCNPVWKFAGGQAHAESKRSHKAVLGWWGMDLAKRLVHQHRMPICIFNGAVGGTRIDQHQRDEANPSNLDTIYGRLLWRLQQAKLTHGIRAVIWHQGESDQGAAGPDGGYGWETYQRYFVTMSGAWKRDYPNIRHYYVFQIWPNACAMGQGNGDMLRERQRGLADLYSNLELLSTYGITPPGGCHYPLEGWSKFVDMLMPLINRDLYARDPVRSITPPNLLRAAYTSDARDAITLQFDQAIVWDDELVRQFHLDDAAEQVASGTVDGSRLTLRLAAPSAATRISYLKEMSNWAQAPLLTGANGMAALTFCQVPIAAPMPAIDDPYFYRSDTMASRPIPRPYSHAWSLWMQHHNGLADGLAKQDKVDLLMIGDSITFRFARAGQTVWRKYYETRKGYNFGSSGDRTEHILWRLRNGKLDSIQPKLVTLLIGTNNLMRPDEPPEQTAYAIDAITKEIRRHLPTAKILLLGIFPRGSTLDDPGRLRNEQVNAIISKLHDGQRIFYLDIGDAFLNPDRSLNTELISDGVHPNAKGFEVWAEAMEPTIKRLLSEE
jgi:lysophospholipase L1-like esterase